LKIFILAFVLAHVLPWITDSHVLFRKVVQE
jgi:hypothetical protein